MNTEIAMLGLDIWIDGANEAVLAALREGGEEIADLERQLVRVKTGETRDSIHTETIPDGVEIIAEGNASRLEFGWHTRHGQPVGPFPFARPAYDMVLPSLPEKVAMHLQALAK